VDAFSITWCGTCDLLRLIKIPTGDGMALVFTRARRLVLENFTTDSCKVWPALLAEGGGGKGRTDPSLGVAPRPATTKRLNRAKRKVCLAFMAGLFAKLA